MPFLVALSLSIYLLAPINYKKMNVQSLFSIITINLNNNKGLQKTLQSIEQQKFSSYEHIIIDGGSKDESKETILQYASRTSHLSYWISEKDSGVYNAMNKGIAQSNGRYLLFLNSGDYLEPNIFEQIKSQVTGEDIIYGDLYFVSKSGERRLHIFPDEPPTAARVISSDFFLPHPASFIKKSLFKDEKYTEHYKIISDWEFWVKKILFDNCTIKHIQMGISNFTDGGVSSVTENQTLISREREDVLQKLFPPKVLDSLKKLAVLEKSPISDVIPQISHTQRFQYRMKKFILFSYKIRCFFATKT